MTIANQIGHDCIDLHNKPTGEDCPACRVEQLVDALRGLNQMGGDDRGGYCVCPEQDGSAPDNYHSTACVSARAALRLAGK